MWGETFDCVLYFRWFTGRGEFLEIIPIGIPTYAGMKTGF